MKVDRRDFLGATTAYTSVNLYHPQASGSVWFNGAGAKAPEDFAGINSGPAGLSLTPEVRRKLATARPGQGFVQEQTTHINYEVPSFDPETGEVTMKRWRAAEEPA